MYCLDGKEFIMGFADITDDIRQMAGSAHGLRMEAGCFSGASTTMAVPTQLRHIVGGLMIGCLTSTGSAGRPLIGSVCEGGFAEFTMNYAPAGQATPYVLFGW
jgi:hypothetical protein